MTEITALVLLVGGIALVLPIVQTKFNEKETEPWQDASKARFRARRGLSPCFV